MSGTTPIGELIKDRGDLTQKKRRPSLAGIRFLLCQGISIRNDHNSGTNVTILLEQLLDEGTLVKEKKYQSTEM